MEFNAFVGGSYESEAVTADAERTVNFYVENMQSEGATTRKTLYPIPGVEELSAGGIGPGRAHFFMDDREFAVIATTLYEIDSGGALTARGTVALDDNPATISSNGDGGGELFITSGANGYVYTLATDTLSQVAALNGKATMGDYLDGYFLALDAATSTLYISDLLDGTTWDPTQFAQRSAAPDPWVSMKVNGIYIYLFGEQTSEPWYNTGESPFPFAPYPGIRINYGIAAPFSRAVLGKDIIWLGAAIEGRSMVLRAPGFEPEIISTYPVQSQIDGYLGVSAATADSYSDRGHSFYLLNFAQQGITWAWDAETNLWAERGTWLSDENRFQSWRPRWHAYAFNQHRMLDGESAAVYRMSFDVATDAEGLQIRRLRRAPALMAENEYIFYAAFELDLEPGLGATSGQGEDPQVMLRFSNDGGKTWSSEMMRSAGKLGQYSARVRWNRLGCGRRRVFEVSFTDPIPWRLTNAYLTLAQPVQAGQGQ